jgi:RND family efflux transporter MFP subunit
MAMPEADRFAVAMRLAAELARAQGEREAASAIARAAGLLVRADRVRIWLLDRNRGYRFSGAWPEGDGHPEQTPDDVARAVVFGSPSTAAAEPPHRSRMIVPLLAGLRPLGAVELVEAIRADGPFTNVDVEALHDLVAAANEALGAVRGSSLKDQGHVAAISRLTRLFDLGRSIVAELDMDRLPQVIVDHVMSSFETEGAYLWLVDDSGEQLHVAAATGPTAELVSGWTLPPGHGAAGRVAVTQEAALYDDPEDLPEIETRPDVAAGLEVRELFVAPVVSAGGELLGVLETFNKFEATADESDLAMLTEAAGSAGLALTSAGRLHAERRAGDLKSLLRVARDLGSHLDPQKVAFTLVHRAAAVVRYRRAAVALVSSSGAVELAAVSGETFVDAKLPEMQRLTDLLTWAAGLEEGIYVVQEDDGTIEIDRAETAEKFRAYFAATGARSFLAAPLRDEEGNLGVFSVEAAEPYAFAGRELEAISLLATQAGVSIRNALLYERIPMARVFQPLADQKERWLRVPRARLFSRLGALALVLAILILVPVPLRVGGRARVLPERRLPVTAEVQGRVAQVFVQEGDRIEPGQVIAQLDDRELRAAHTDAATRLRIARREQDRFRAAGHPAGAAVQEARLEGLRAEVDLWESRLDRARLRSPVAGIVATPRVDERVGTMIDRGEAFCEVVDPRRQTVEVAVPEADSGLVEEGMPLRVKLFAHPTRSFRGTVEKVGVTATLHDGQRVFLVRARLDGTDAPLRSGMTGQVKINTGAASLGRVMFRRPARWLWGAFWRWLP